MITGNYDGVVLIHSDGIVRKNTINNNQRSGVMCGGGTIAIIDSNSIECNIEAGVTIRDKSLPDLKKNEI